MKKGPSQRTAPSQNAARALQNLKVTPMVE